LDQLLGARERQTRVLVEKLDDSKRLQQRSAAGNESVPKIIKTNNTVNLFLISILILISILVILNDNSLRVMFDKIASVTVTLRLR